MSAALYIVLNTPTPGFDVFVNGKALSRHDKALRSLAASLGVTPLMDFFSMSAGDVAEFVPPDARGPAHEERWYPPEAGLATVRALLQHGRRGSAGLPDGVGDDLLEFERVLTNAQRHGFQWHLAVDY